MCYACISCLITYNIYQDEVFPFFWPERKTHSFFPFSSIILLSCVWPCLQIGKKIQPSPAWVKVLTWLFPWVASALASETKDIGSQNRLLTSVWSFFLSFCSFSSTLFFVLYLLHTHVYDIVGRPMLFWVIDNLVFSPKDTLWIPCHIDLETGLNILAFFPFCSFFCPFICSLVSVYPLDCRFPNWKKT